MSEQDTWIVGQRVVVQGAVVPRAIRVRGGMIAELCDVAAVPEGAPVTDAGDCWVLPGLVDSHVHINDPGRTDWEGFDTATRAAVAGGVTTLLDMPLNSIPATGGFFIAGTSSPARSLAALTNRVASSSAAAASASFGMMVAQLYVADLNLAWKMGATLRRSNSTTSQGTFEFTIPVPAPGAIALLGVAGLAGGRRRRA